MKSKEKEIKSRNY